MKEVRTTTTLIHPLGVHLERLKANTGLDRYTVAGPVKAETVALPGGCCGAIWRGINDLQRWNPDYRRSVPLLPARIQERVA